MIIKHYTEIFIMIILRFFVQNSVVVVLFTLFLIPPIATQ